MRSLRKRHCQGKRYGCSVADVTSMLQCCGAAIVSASHPECSFGSKQAIFSLSQTCVELPKTDVLKYGYYSLFEDEDTDGRRARRVVRG